MGKQEGKIDRDALIKRIETRQTELDSWIRTQVLENDRTDILAQEVLGFTVTKMHLSMMKYQMRNKESLHLVFRGAGKSTVLSTTFIIWLILKDPNVRILIASKTSSHSKSILREVKEHIQDNEVFKRIFGDIVGEKWDESEISVASRTKPAKEPTVMCIGIGGQLVGKHFDVVICDDLVDEDNSRTEYMRNRIKVWYYKVLHPTIEPHARLHIIGTRYHFDDLYGHLISNDMAGKVHRIMALDDRGRSPWPEKYPAEFFVKKRKQLGMLIFNCHDEETQYLTQDGWKLYEDVLDTDLLMSLDQETNELRFEAPLSRFQDNYEGPMVRVKNRSVDALVTPNHNMLAAPCRSRKGQVQEGYELVPAADLKDVIDRSSRRVIVPTSGNWIGTERATFKIPSGECFAAQYKDRVDPEIDVEMDIFLEFLGFFVSEGSTVAKTRGPISFSQNRGDLCDRMKHLIEEMGFTLRNSSYEVHDVFGFSHIGLWKWLRENCGTNSGTKRVPRFVFELSQRQQRIFLKALADGDGSWSPKVLGAFWYSTTSYQLSEDIHELGLRCGVSYSNKVREQQNPKWNTQYLGYACENPKRFRTVSESSITTVDYDGKVSCFEMPSGTLVTKRNNRVLISGNSQFLCDVEAMKGEVFHYDWIDEVNPQDVPEGGQIYGGIDLAIKTGEENDYFAIVIIKITENGHIWVLGSYQGHLSFNEQTKRILQWWRTGADGWTLPPASAKSELVEFGIETVAYQDAQYQQLKEQEPTMRLRPIITHKDKMTRAWKLTSLFEEGKVHIVKGQVALIESLVLFPNGSKDLFDALELAIQCTRKSRAKRTRSKRGRVGVI